MGYVLTTARVTDPVTLAEAKLHLRVDTSADDALITALITAATDEAEQLMQRATLPQSWTLTLDGFDGPIVLQRPPVTAITSLKYLQAVDGVLTILAGSEYLLAAANEYTARVVPAFGKAWPGARAQLEAVRVEFVTGYADAGKVPESIKAWIRLRVGALYQNREAWTLGKAIEANPFVDRLLDRYCALTC